MYFEPYSDVCTISTSSHYTLETILEVPYVYKRDRIPKITYTTCKQCGAPVSLDVSYCPWCKVPYEWAHELEVV